MTDTKTFLISYPYQGNQWGLEIQAENFEDAEARLKALAWAKVDGELKFKIPVPSSKWWRFWK